MKTPNNNLKIIGRLEQVDLPEWNISGLKAKIDTGAYTSSIHCHQIELKEHDNKSIARFKLLDPSHDNYNRNPIEWPIFRTKPVKSSNGQSEQRIIVKTKITISGQTFTANFSLTDRSAMRYPLLIGRKLLKNRFLVDVSRKFKRT